MTLDISVFEQDISTHVSQPHNSKIMKSSLLFVPLVLQFAVLRGRFAILLTLLIALPFSRSSANPGDLDPAFGTGGKVTTDFHGFYDYIDSFVFDSTGRIVVAGGAKANASVESFDIALARYSAAGVLDTSFGTGGKVNTDFSGNVDQGYSVALDSNGRIVVSGASGGDMAVARYTPAGVLDASFASGGKLVINISAGDVGNAVAIDANDQIVVGGAAGSDFVLVRLTSAGLLDTSFGNGGVVSTDFGGSDLGVELKIDDSERILLVGLAGSNFGLARYTSAGVLDSAFGSGGKVTTDFGGADTGWTLAFDNEGGIIVAGWSNNDFALARYSGSGVLDTGFGSGGKVTTDFHGNTDECWSVVVDSIGNIILAGLAQTSTSESSSNFALARYTSAGILDATFGSGGKVTTDFNGGADHISCLGLDSAGNLIAAGRAAQTGTDSNFAVARYFSFGEPEIALKIDNTPIPGGGSHIFAITNLGQEQVATVAINNLGEVPLTGIAASIAPVGSLDFRVGSPPPATTIAVGATETFSVIFSPQAPGNRTATLNVVSDSVPIPYVIHLSGTGLDTTPPTITTPAMDYYGDCDEGTTEIAAFLSSHGSAEAEDNEGPVTWTDDYNGTLPDCGDYITVTFTATDMGGLSASTSARFYLFPPGAIWVGPATFGAWTSAFNWRNGTLPTAATDTYVDFFDFQDTVLQVPGGQRYTKNLFIGQGDTLRLGDSTSVTLTIAGDTIHNEGELRILKSNLLIDGATSLIGTGLLVLTSDGRNAIGRSNNSILDVLTVSSDQEITTTGDTIAEYQHTAISAGLENHGTVTADGGGMTLYQNSKVNRGVFRAINGGLLRMETPVDNVTGNLQAGAASTLKLENTLTGGGIAGPGRLLVNTNVGLTGPITLAVDLTTAAEGGTTKLTGTFTNEGQILVGVVGGSSIAELSIDSAVTLEGGGSVILQGAGRRRITRANAWVGDVLTVGVDQEIKATAGSVAEYQNCAIHTGLLNYGTITADAGGMTLYLNSKTNLGLFRAINGGVLRMEAPVDNSVGTLLAGQGSTLQLENTLTGGEISGPGRLLISNAGLIGPITLAADLTTAAEGGTTKLTGTFTNEGQILVGVVGGSSIAELSIDGAVTLEGDGSVILHGTGRRRITRANAAVADVLTVGLNQEIKATAGSVAEYQNCAIQAGLMNYGTITADAGGMTLYLNSKTNLGLFRAINGGLLRMETPVDNSVGTLLAGQTSTLKLEDTLTGGMVTGPGRLLINSNAGLTGPITLAAGLTTAVEGGTTKLTGTVTNDSQLLLGVPGGSAIATLSINGAVTLNGTGKIILGGAGRRQIVRANSSATDALTVGAAQEVAATAGTIAEYQNAAIEASLVNQGTITADQGGLLLYQGPKTNQGTFRAIRGGALVSYPSLITNYNATTDTLTGGHWEVISEGTTTTLEIQSSPITTIAANTFVCLSGANASFPQLSTLTNVAGTLCLENGKSFTAAGNLTVTGTLEFGLTDGSVNGFDAGRIVINGNANFTGATIHIRDRGITAGIYEIARWTGTVTGNPVLGDIPQGLNYGLLLDTETKTLRLQIIDNLPKILAIQHDATSNTTTIDYQSVSGVVHQVRGTSDFLNYDNLPETVIGTGAVLQYLHQPAGISDRYFYLFSSPLP